MNPLVQLNWKDLNVEEMKKEAPRPGNDALKQVNGAGSEIVKAWQIAEGDQNVAH
jgi:hypothetical protein